MKKRMSVLGIGPKLIIIGLTYTIFCIILNSYYHDVFVIRFIPRIVMTAISIVLLGIGIPFWIVSGWTMIKAYKSDVLCTKGVFSICRHPIYTAAILFVMPGMLLFLHSWIIISIPVVMIIVCNFLIKAEDKYLEERYPNEYPKYRKTVNAFLPKIF